MKPHERFQCCLLWPNGIDSAALAGCIAAKRKQSPQKFGETHIQHRIFLSMSFLKWFSDKSRQAKIVANAESRHPGIAQQPQLAVEGSRLKRHARREQLYVAVREAMTHGGVLSASYKFKVLSLDQTGNEFLIMLDLGKGFEGGPEQLGAIEALIVQNSKARFEITVPAVYWRIDAAAATSKPQLRYTDGAAPEPDPHAKTLGVYEPIRSEEVAAFKQALLAASARSPTTAVQSAKKSRTNTRSYTLLTGFEDTVIAEPTSGPALSATQYGDLN